MVEDEARNRLGAIEADAFLARLVEAARAVLRPAGDEVMTASPGAAPPSGA